MKRPSFYVAIVLLTSMIVLLPPNNYAWLEQFDWMPSKSATNHPQSEKQSTKQQEVEPAAVPAIQRMKSLPSKTIRGATYYPLTQLIQANLIQAKTKKADGLVEFTANQDTYQIVRNVPVYMRNGIYYPLIQGTLRWETKDFWLPESFLQTIFQPAPDENDAKTYAQNKDKISKMSASEMVDYLSFVQTPIKGSKMKRSDTSIPGAARTYRNGIHEGVDFYTVNTGVPVTKQTKVYSMAEGIVVRADHDYKEMSTAERNELLLETKNNGGQTPQYLFDRLRGRTVWIQHSNGLLARYIHLSQINPDLKVGEKIQTGEFIGYVGNSGTSNGAKGNNLDVHLHLDLFLYGEWFWNQYNRDEIYQILFKMF